MTLLRDIASELIGMFLADACLTGAVLALVLLVAALTLGLGVPPLIAGGVLLLGCLVILAGVAWREASRQDRV